MASLGDERGHLEWMSWCCAVVNYSVLNHTTVIVLETCPSVNPDESMGDRQNYFGLYHSFEGF